MTQASVVSNAADVAFAAYATLRQGLVDQQLSALIAQGFSLRQAEDFASRYPAVVLPTFSDSSSDFDVTVLKDASGNLTLAIRGTLTSHDLVFTDLQIGKYGAGFDQIVALCNWWQRVSTPTGQVDQFTLKSYTTTSQGVPANGTPGAVYLYADPSKVGLGGETTTTHWFLEPALSVAATAELVPLLAADPDRKIDVTGHSLGAHLALAFASLFRSQVGLAVGFNTPGFIDNSINQQFFAALGGDVPTPANSTEFISVVADEAKIGSK